MIWLNDMPTQGVRYFGWKKRGKSLLLRNSRKTKGQRTFQQESNIGTGAFNSIVKKFNEAMDIVFEKGLLKVAQIEQSSDPEGETSSPNEAGANDTQNNAEEEPTEKEAAEEPESTPEL